MVPVVKFVESEAALLPVLSTLNTPDIVPAFWVIVWALLPPMVKVRLAPPKVSVVDMLNAPCTVQTLAAAGLLMAPSVRVRAPEIVQSSPTVTVPELVLLTVKLPSVTPPQVKVPLVVLPSKVTAELAGNTAPEVTVKLPLKVIVGVAAVVRVELAPAVKDPMIPVPVAELTSSVAKLLMVIVPLLVIFPFWVQAVTLPEMTPVVTELVIPPSTFEVKVPVPTVMVPLLVK